MSTLLALGVFVLLIVAAVAGVLLLDRRLNERVEQEDRARCDACISGGGVTMLPPGPRYPLCDKHQARLMIMELEQQMDGEA